MTRLIAFFLCLFAAMAAPTANASSANEPPYKVQLRSCFEADRPTESIVSEAIWSSTRPAPRFPNYNYAVAVSTSCMRSVCSAGSKNGLCCNTYCTMFGLTGDGHKRCFNICYNGSN